jgi:hypothetical protein
VVARDRSFELAGKLEYYGIKKYLKVEFLKNLKYGAGTKSDMWGEGVKIQKGGDLAPKFRAFQNSLLICSNMQLFGT